ncbi:MAG: radical SAM protein [Candidatus Aenigmarchaeota archaeon]|nr:radical SAM protein [Candidatus Aenigmarchaeota archaeon]
MRQIKRIFSNSRLIGDLPRGCYFCTRGSKLVLFVTGKCKRNCWYCTISEKRWQKPVVLANERTAKSDEEIIEEARLISAEGAGITGGEPLLDIERTIHFIELLKKSEGKGFHIHLYTTRSDLTEEELKGLYGAGLDEIRFHLQDDWDVVKKAVKFDWDVGVEVPVVPEDFEMLKKLILFCENSGVKFLNLNELEFSDRNVGFLTEKGYEIKDNEPTAVKGSEAIAKKLLEYANEHTKKLNVHYCSAATKNIHQLKKRWIRRANKIKKDYEIVDQDGFIVKGIIEADEPRNVLEKIIKKYKIESRLIRVKGDKIETSIHIAEMLAKKEKNLKIFMVKELPIEETWEVERWPL